MEGYKEIHSPIEKLQNETQNPDKEQSGAHSPALPSRKQLDSTTATTRDCTPWLAPLPLIRRSPKLSQASLCTTPVLKPSCGDTHWLSYQTHSSDVLKHRKEIQSGRAAKKTRCPLSLLSSSTCSHPTFKFSTKLLFFIKSFFFLILIFPVSQIGNTSIFNWLP